MSPISEKEKTLLEAIVEAYKDETNVVDKVIKTAQFVAVFGSEGKLVAELGLAGGNMFGGLELNKSYTKEELGL